MGTDAPMKQSNKASAATILPTNQGPTRWGLNIIQHTENIWKVGWDIVIDNVILDSIESNIIHNDIGYPLFATKNVPNYYCRS